MTLIRDTVIDFLTAQAGPVCATCLSRALGVKFDQIMDAVSDIRLRGDLPIKAGRCSRCSAEAAAIVYPRPAA